MVEVFFSILMFLIFLGFRLVRWLEVFFLELEFVLEVKCKLFGILVLLMYILLIINSGWLLLVREEIFCRCIVILLLGVLELEIMFMLVILLYKVLFIVCWVVILVSFWFEMVDMLFVRLECFILEVRLVIIIFLRLVMFFFRVIFRWLLFGVVFIFWEVKLV